MDISADTASVGMTLNFQWTEDTLAKGGPFGVGALRKAQHLKSVTHSNRITEFKILTAER